MHLDLSWIFSIFKISRPARGSKSDARNFRRGNSNYYRHLVRRAPCFYDYNVKSLRDATFSIPEELASTSTTIIKAGLNKIWRKTNLKAPPESRLPEPGYQVPSFPLQKPENNEKPPPKASQHGRIRAGQYPSYSSSLSSLLFDFLPNAVSPSQSLLFLPPTPLLPPAPELKPDSNQSDTTYPVRTPDHDSNTTLSLSPLPISLSLEFPPLASPPPPELVIKIAGPKGYLNGDHHKSQITKFLSSRLGATEVANSLVVIWQLSQIDTGCTTGLTSLKALFAQLDEKVLDSDRTALSWFSKISLTIPDQVKDVAPNRPVQDDDSIDLANAMNVHEFTWHGDFVIFASKVKNLQFVTLTRLNIKSSDISIKDAITILHSCPGLQTLSLGTIRSEEDSDAIMSESLKTVGGVERRKALPSNLTYLALESDVALHPLIRRFWWTTQVSLSLTLRKQGTSSLIQALDSGSP